MLVFQKWLPHCLLLESKKQKHASRRPRLMVRMCFALLKQSTFGVACSHATTRTCHNVSGRRDSNPGPHGGQGKARIPSLFRFALQESEVNGGRFDQQKADQQQVVEEDQRRGDVVREVQRNQPQGHEEQAKRG